MSILSEAEKLGLKVAGAGKSTLAKGIGKDAASRISRRMVSGINVSVIGEQLEPERLEQFTRHLTSLAEQWPSVAKNIDKVQILNSPAVTDRMTKNLMPMQGLALPHGERSFPWSKIRSTEGWASHEQISGAIWAGGRKKSRILIDANRIGTEEYSPDFGRFREGNIEDVLTHEFGHHVQETIQKGPSLAQGSAVMDTSIAQIFDTHLGESNLGGVVPAPNSKHAFSEPPNENSIDDYVSKIVEMSQNINSEYAMSAPTELFAETFLAAQQGHEGAGKVMAGVSGLLPKSTKPRPPRARQVVLATGSKSRRNIPKALADKVSSNISRRSSRRGIDHI